MNFEEDGNQEADNGDKAGKHIFDDIRFGFRQRSFYGWSERWDFPRRLNRMAEIISPAAPGQRNRFEHKQENRKRDKRENAQTLEKSRAGRQFVAAHVLPEAARQFKLLAVQMERTTQSLLIPHYWN